MIAMRLIVFLVCSYSRKASDVELIKSFQTAADYGTV